MHDELAMRGRHRRGDFVPQREARVDIEPRAIAVGVDELAVDVFQRQPRYAVAPYAAIEQARYARVLQSREDLPFLLEARHQVRCGEARPQALDRRRLLVAAVRALGMQHARHAAVCERGACAPRSEALAARVVVGESRPQFAVEQAGQRVVAFVGARE